MHETPLPDQDTGETRWSMILRMQGEGADEGWRWFLTRYEPVIRAMLQRRLPRALANDAEAEFWGYLFASRALGRADRTRRFRAYLAGIVTNFARAFQRRQRPGGQHEGGIEQLAASADHDFEQVELRAWARHTLMLALATMEAEFPAQVATLRWFYGLPDAGGAGAPITVTEIAARTGKKIATVHQDLTRGRQRLRHCIERDLRETVGNADEWRDELRLVCGAIESERPGLLPRP